MKGIYVCVCMLAMFCAAAMALPEDCRQVIVGTSDGWNSSHVKLSLLEKGPQGWMMVKGPFPAAWGSPDWYGAGGSAALPRKVP